MSRILIVDDEPDMRLAVRNVLKLRGYDIYEAGDGPTALEMAKADRPDLVLLDMRLPGMDGIEVLEGLKKIDDTLPVVMITGYGHIQSAVDVMKLGASEYLQKPFENAQLVETVKKFAHGTTVAPRRSYAVAPSERPEQPVFQPAPRPAAAPYRRESRPRGRSALAAIALAVLLSGAALYRYINVSHEAYYREYPGVAANISAMVWREDNLIAGDWLARAVYVYAREGENLKLADTFQLEKTHISGLAAAGDTLYVADSWRKLIEARSIAPARRSSTAVHCSGPATPTATRCCAARTPSLPRRSPSGCRKNRTRSSATASICGRPFPPPACCTGTSWTIA